MTERFNSNEPHIRSAVERRAHAEGMAARSSGIPLTLNPYRGGSKSSVEAWSSGWCDADMGITGDAWPVSV